MFKTADSLEGLYKIVADDKKAQGMGAANQDRYPIRFVLFDNFSDCYSFVEYMQGQRNVHVYSVDKWTEPEYPDMMITQGELASRILDHIHQMSPSDCLIAPFSELARFYDNQRVKAFDALVKTIKAIQASLDGVNHHQRVYIPIVGLEGKMETFANDSQIYIWKLIAQQTDINYKLILVPDGEYYGVKGLEAKHTMVSNLHDWLNLWKDGKNIKSHIICSSRSIYANAINAQPDNAFTYEVCCNEYQFLVNGLQLSFGSITYQESDSENWLKLAASIDASLDFCFTKFVLTYFEKDQISDYKDFIRLWFSHPSSYDRWLLTLYYCDTHPSDDYICAMLRGVYNYGSLQLIEHMATDMPQREQEIAIRSYCLRKAIDNNVHLSEAVETQLGTLLSNMPSTIGYTSALRYFTGIARCESELIIRWLGNNNVTIESIESIFPDLYHYLSDGIGILGSVPDWVENYMLEYKKAKISNTYTPAISEHIGRLNASASDFYKWYNQFSNTYTRLQNRGDIEVFFWIDGLGIDWIPLVQQIVREKADKQIYLNEVMIARAQLPTRTDINKQDLQRLLHTDAEQLPKKGDLDAQAHKQGNISPFSIIDEVALVRDSIEEILAIYNGKKIAIVSDHGLTYLSQLVPGKNLAGVESDHYGRIAVANTPSDKTDNSYLRLDDRTTLCALRHESLCGKVPSGQGAHGGCTPEEVLVPIFVISSSPANTNWSATLLTAILSGTSPRARFRLLNIPSSEKPYVLYNGSKYDLHHVNGDEYETSDLIVDATATDISVVVGSVSRLFDIQISTGIQENDLFDF